MGKLLWEPSPDLVKQSNMAQFIDFVNGKYGLKIQNYWQLQTWSTDKIADFWKAMWEFGGIVSSRSYDKVVDDLTKFPGAKWFPGARLNFAQNLLKHRDDHYALLFRGETQKTAQMTYGELYARVAALAKWLVRGELHQEIECVLTFPIWPKRLWPCLPLQVLGLFGLPAGLNLGQQLFWIVSVR